jgi:hypothetical protein
MNNIEFIYFGDFTVNADRILYVWQRPDALHCFLKGGHIPLIWNCQYPVKAAEELHRKHSYFIAVGEYLVNPAHIAYAWTRLNGTQIFLTEHPIPLMGTLRDDRLKNIHTLSAFYKGNPTKDSTQ